MSETPEPAARAEQLSAGLPVLAWRRRGGTVGTASAAKGLGVLRERQGFVCAGMAQFV